MNDYEMGRLAEELIEKRFADKIKGYEKEAKEALSRNRALDEENRKLKDKKVYLRYDTPHRPFMSFGGCYRESPYIYVGVDEVTKDLKDTKEELGRIKEYYRMLKLDFSILPWYKKMMFIFKEAEDG